LIALGQVVNLLEILRSYAQAYAKGADILRLCLDAINAHRERGEDCRKNAPLMKRMREDFWDLSRHCEHLPMTFLALTKIINAVNKPEYYNNLEQAETVFIDLISDVQSRLPDELSLNLFFKLPIEKAKYFDAPRIGWEDAIDRFPEALYDIEEMSKCFALSRYAACVFHSVSAIEAGLEHLGKFLSVTDHQSGWTSVSRELNRIVNKKYTELNSFEKGNRAFIEQMQGVTEALKSAWRNKISHAQGKLTLMTSEFSPDVAEEIMIASRSFMRRLATEMPGGSL
jgi:hypothetical protein